MSNEHSPGLNRSTQSGPGLGEAILLLLIMLLVTAVSMMLLMPGGRESALDICLLAIAELLAVAVVLLIGLRRVRRPAGEIFRLKPAPLALTIPAIPLAVAVVIILQTLESVIQSIYPVPDRVVSHMLRLLYADTPWQWVRVIMVVVIVVPILEELLYRALFLRGFTLRYGRPTAVLLSSLLFVIIHMNPWGFISIFLSGCLLAWLMYKTHSIWPCILWHGVYNCCSVILTRLIVQATGGQIDPVLISTSGPFIWDQTGVIISAVVVMILSLLWYHKKGHTTSPWRMTVSPESPGSAIRDN